MKNYGYCPNPTTVMYDRINESKYINERRNTPHEWVDGAKYADKFIEDKKGFVYVIIHEKLNICKVGLAYRSVEQRLRQLNFPDLQIRRKKYVRDCKKCEKELHRKLKHIHYEREWFKDIEEVLKIWDEHIKEETNVSTN